VTRVSRISSVLLIVVGVVAVVVGLVFMGQGANLIPGSFMTGDRTWLGVGLVLAVVGVVLAAFGLRRRRPER
jgi:cation transporter-like permease